MRDLDQINFKEETAIAAGLSIAAELVSLGLLAAMLFVWFAILGTPSEDDMRPIKTSISQRKG